jgi:hypothetical protein
MGLHTEQRQIALHRALGDTSLIGELAHTPMRGSLRSAAQCRIQQHRNIFFRMSARPPRLELIVQTRQALLTKAPAPIGDCRWSHLHTPRGLAYRHAALAQQNHVRAPYQPVRQAA